MTTTMMPRFARIELQQSEGVRTRARTLLQLFALGAFGVAKPVAELAASSFWVSWLGSAVHRETGQHGYVLAFAALVAIALAGLAAGMRDVDRGDRLRVARWLRGGLVLFVPLGIAAGLALSAWLAFVIPALKPHLGPDARGGISAALLVGVYIAVYVVADRWSKGIVDAR